MTGNASAVPGPLGAQAAPPVIDKGTAARESSPLPCVIGTDPPPAVASPKPPPAIDDDTRILAATVYGEGSTANVFEEMAAIANVLVRQQKARGYVSISAFIRADRTFAFAAHDGSARFGKLMAAKDEDIARDTGMDAAVKGARNALSPSPVDHSNGAYFWDGLDIKTDYARHPKVLGGIHITDPAHNVVGIKDNVVEGENWLLDAKGNKTRSRGKWQYKYESTAGFGATIFWKYNPAFVKASGNREYK